MVENWLTDHSLASYPSRGHSVTARLVVAGCYETLRSQRDTFAIGSAQNCWRNEAARLSFARLQREGPVLRAWPISHRLRHLDASKSDKFAFGMNRIPRLPKVSYWSLVMPGRARHAGGRAKTERGM